MRPNEKLHGPLKDAYHNSNGRDFAQQVRTTALPLFVIESISLHCTIIMQILRIDHNRLTIKLLRSRLNSLEEYKQQAEGMEDNKETGTAGISDTQSSIANGHIQLGSPCTVESIQDVKATHGLKDGTFEGFRRKFTEFVNQSLLSYGYALTQWFNVPLQFEVSYPDLYPAIKG